MQDAGTGFLPPEWPRDGIESVSNCPVCGAGARELLYERLSDQVFFCAPGMWNMYRCELCASVYLNPRPTQETIGLAYQHYFTHYEAPGFSDLNFQKKIRLILANGYRNYRFGTRDFPASMLGILAVSLMPNGRALLDAGMRHLPKKGTNNRLLDVGCGNGTFLLRARSAGWEVVGVDFDRMAIKMALSQGLDARLGGVEVIESTGERFDVITLSHVIEHVHYPVEVLKACYRLLKPGGILWLETPNIASEGHRLFGASWRGLEPPRHLVLFTLESMRNAIKCAGFSNLKVHLYRPLCKEIFDASKAISEGNDPNSMSRASGPSDIVNMAEQVAKRDPARREFITVTAWKG